MPDEHDRSLATALAAAADHLEIGPPNYRNRVRTVIARRVATALAAMVLVGVGLAGISAIDQDVDVATTSPATQPSASVPAHPGQVMVPAADAPGLGFETYPELPLYRVVFESPTGQTLVLQSMLNELLPEHHALLDAAPSTVLPNGLTVKLLCGSLAGDPEENPAALTPAGPITAGWVDGDRYYSLVETPQASGECTPPPVAQGPLLDAAATLRWVDQTEFERLALEFVLPSKTDPP